jgi:hypothetical protein
MVKKDKQRLPDFREALRRIKSSAEKTDFTRHRYESVTQTMAG